MVTARRKAHKQVGEKNGNRRSRQNSLSARKQRRTGEGAFARTSVIADVLSVFPEAGTIVAAYGLHCFGCDAGAVETVEQGCRVHDLSDEEIEELLDDLNSAFVRLPSMPDSLTLTTAAAKAVAKIAKEEKRNAAGLTVTTDGRGGFCMEFSEERKPEDREFSNTAVPAVRLFASPLTLKRIGGSTIDFREGRFKLDLLKDLCDGSGKCGKERDGNGNKQ